MPLIFHKTDVKNIKGLLEEKFSLSFDDNFLHYDKLRNDISRNCQDIDEFRSLSSRKRRKLFYSLIEKVYSDCMEVFGCDCYNYMSDSSHSLVTGYGFLKYVLMDTFLNVELSFLKKDSIENLIYKNMAQFYRSNERLSSLICDEKDTTTVKTTETRSDSDNFTKLVKLAEEVPFINQNFLARSNKQIIDNEIFSNFIKEIPEQYIPIIKNYEKINGILITFIKRNPYCVEKDKQTSLADVLYSFVTSIYPNVRKKDEEIKDYYEKDENHKVSIIDKYDFSFHDELEYIKAMHYLDAYYDWMNNLSIATKLKNYEMKYPISPEEKNLILDVLCRCILIPDVFNKVEYIDLLFETLFNNRNGKLRYCDSAENSVANKIMHEEIFNTNIRLCHEYISYISKIFLPVLSAYFYVSLSEIIGDDEKLFEILKIAVIEIVGEHYSDYKIKCTEVFRFKDKKLNEYEYGEVNTQIRNYKQSATRGIKENLAPLYDKIRINYFSDHLKYRKMLEELSLF